MGRFDVTATWTGMCGILRVELGDNTFGSWLAQAQLRVLDEGELAVVTPDRRGA